MPRQKVFYNKKEQNVELWRKQTDCWLPIVWEEKREKPTDGAQSISGGESILYDTIMVDITCILSKPKEHTIQTM